MLVSVHCPCTHCRHFTKHKWDSLLRVSSGNRSMLGPCARQTQTLPPSILNLGQMRVTPASSPYGGCMCSYPVAQKSPKGWAPMPTVVTCPWTHSLLSVLRFLFHTSLPPLLGITSQIRFTSLSWGLLLGDPIHESSGIFFSVGYKKLYSAPCFPLLGPVFLNIRIITRLIELMVLSSFLTHYLKPRNRHQSKQTENQEWGQRPTFSVGHKYF